MLFGANKEKSFDINEKHTNTDLKKITKKLNPLDRKRFREVMEDKIKAGRTMSTRGILKTVGDEYGYNIKQRIKKAGFVNEPTAELTDKQLRHNFALSRERQRAEEEQSQAPRSTYFQPGTTEHHSQSSTETEPDNQTGIFQRNS